MQAIRDVMTGNPLTMSPDTNLVEAARTMRDQSVGDVLITEGGTLRGIATDRDIVVRAIAEGRDPASTSISEVCSVDLQTVGPDSPVEEAVRLMRERAVRRLPVVENNSVVGVVSIGDLAIERDQSSALADISAAPPNS